MSPRSRGDLLEDRCEAMSDRDWTCVDCEETFDSWDVDPIIGNDDSEPRCEECDRQHDRELECAEEDLDDGGNENV